MKQTRLFKTVDIVGFFGCIAYLGAIVSAVGFLTSLRGTEHTLDWVFVTTMFCAVALILMIALGKLMEDAKAEEHKKRHSKYLRCSRCDGFLDRVHDQETAKSSVGECIKCGALYGFEKKEHDR